MMIWAEVTDHREVKLFISVPGVAVPRVSPHALNRMIAVRFNTLCGNYYDLVIIASKRVRLVRELGLKPD